MTSQYPEQYDCGRVNLWVKDSKKTDDKFLSGIIEFFQPDGTLVKLNIRAFKNNKRNERSADFYGSLSIDVDGVAFVEFSEKVDDVEFAEEKAYSRSKTRPASPASPAKKVVKQAVQQDDSDLPLF
jgi:hypothetical protein